MKYSITAPKSLNTTIHLPASKSLSNRALVIHALAGGTIQPTNLSDCDDTEVIVCALKEMPSVIDIKAAGTAMRFMTAFLSVSEGKHTLTGTKRMQQRPIGILVNALRRLGADISYLGEEGYPPLLICGRKLDGGSLEIPGNVSSQYISALLMIGPALVKGLTLKLTDTIVSRPYIDMTLDIMREFGADVEWTDIDTVSVRPQPYKNRAYTIENDWSAASYWFEALALSAQKENQICLPGLWDRSQQGDAIVRYLFNMLGVKTSFSSNKSEGITLTSNGHTLPRLEYDFVNQPDLSQTMIATCCALNIPFTFTGLESLRIKETDRISAMRTELRKFGFCLHEIGDSTLQWDGKQLPPEDNPVVDTYEDHRMAMSFAPLSFKFGPIVINHPEVVSKSYPHFWEDLASCGFGVTKIPE